MLSLRSRSCPWHLGCYIDESQSLTLALLLPSTVGRNCRWMLPLQTKPRRVPPVASFVQRCAAELLAARRGGRSDAPSIHHRADPAARRRTAAAPVRAAADRDAHALEHASTFRTRAAGRRGASRHHRSLVGR